MTHALFFAFCNHSHKSPCSTFVPATTASRQSATQSLIVLPLAEFQTRALKDTTTWSNSFSLPARVSCRLCTGHSIALFHSHKHSGQSGGITRLLACSKDQLKTYQGLDIGPTFVHHNHRADERMNYAAFNKPASVKYWVHSGAVPAGVEYVMQLDADMLIHRPLDPVFMGVKPGTVVSAPYDYLIGTHTALPDVFGVKNKHLQARVGGVHVFHITDLTRIAPLWLNFTERVRDFACREPERYYELASPNADRNDHSQEGKGRRRQFMWMVEMYGYVFGAAEAGVPKHIVARDLMRYTGDVNMAPGPYIIHYGIDWQVKWKDGGGVDREYDFNKLLYLTLDPPSCPRWFFPLPPFSDQNETVGAAAKPYRDALCGKQIRDFNVALCGYYSRHCQRPPQCPPPDGEVARTQQQRDGHETVCVDLTQNCLSWARMGECDNNPGFMAGECAQSCGKCDAKRHPRALIGAPDRTCQDDAGDEGGCASLAALGACDSQRPHMQEACRRTCNLCNASKDAFKDGGGHGRQDTAAHQCPDGSDLGGGEVLVDSKGAEEIAVEAAEDDESRAAALSIGSASSAAGGAAGGAGGGAAGGAGGGAAAAHGESHDASSPAREGGAKRTVMPRPATAAHAEAAAAEHATPPSATQKQRSASTRVGQLLHRGEVLSGLDMGMLAWPFALVQGMCMMFLGYLLRGYLDRRSKRRRMAPLPHGHNF